MESTLEDKICFINDDEINTVLGLKWSNENGAFSYSELELGSGYKLACTCTKRTVLSLMAKVFDPCGFISPFIMHAKILFQHIWKSGMSWDDDLPHDLGLRFIKWIDSTKYLSSLLIERQYFPNMSWKNIEYLEIHGFGDASDKGYGACVYLRLC